MGGAAARMRCSLRQQALNKKTSSLAHLFTTLYLIDSKTVSLQRTSDKHPIVTEIKTGNKINRHRINTAINMCWLWMKNMLSYSLPQKWLRCCPTNPEFGHKGLAVPYVPLRLLLYPGDRSKLRRSRGKSCLQSFNNIRLSFFQYTAYCVCCRLNLTLKVHIL